MNETTHWDQIPEGHLADVMLQIAGRIWVQEANFGGKKDHDTHDEREMLIL